MTDHWDLSLRRLVIHVGTVVLAVLTPTVFVVVQTTAHHSWQVCLTPLLAVPRLVRAAVRVRLDHAAGRVTFHRVFGSTLDTGVTRVRRIDHGTARMQRLTVRRRRRHILRVVTDDGTITLSPWFGVERDRIADALVRCCPNVPDARPAPSRRDELLPG